MGEENVLLSLLIVVVPAIISAIVSLRLGKSQSRSIKVDIEKKYQEMLNVEISERQKLSERFNALEKELRKYMRAYDFSIRHIKLIDPENSIPDFIELSTEEIIEYRKNRFGE